jgi:hypothetical protein
VSRATCQTSTAAPVVTDWTCAVAFEPRELRQRGRGTKLQWTRDAAQRHTAGSQRGCWLASPPLVLPYHWQQPGAFVTQMTPCLLGCL